MTRPLAPAAVVLFAACARAAAPGPAAPPAFPFGGVGQVTRLAPDVHHEQFVVPARDGRGPWAVHVLRAAPATPGCARVRALKPLPAAEGRATTSALFAARAQFDSAVVGAVNADFFSFSPPGVPVGAHVQGGRVIAGPSASPVFAVDSARRPWVGVLRTGGGLVVAADTLRIDAWNRGRRDGVVVFDGGWGPRTDSVPGRVFVTLAPAEGAPGNELTEMSHPRERRRYAVVRVDTGAVAPLDVFRAVVAVGPGAPAAERARWLAVRPGAPVGAAVTFAPFRPVEAVGGRPVLVRGGAVAPEVDTEGSASFRGVNPRTVVGITRDGGLLLVTVDGRQPGYSGGTTLRETAELMRALGAEDALNLDGGGSTTMVVRDAAGRAAVVNRPSDAAGERPVANALAVARCGAR